MQNKIDLIRKILEQAEPEELEEVISQQKAKLTQISKEISDKLTERDKEEVFLKFLEGIFRSRGLVVRPAVIDDKQTFLHEWNSKGHRSDSRFSNLTLAESSKLALMSHGKPMTTDEIYLALKEGGFPFKAVNPRPSIETVLNRNRRIFRKIKPHTWDLIQTNN